MAEKQEAQYFLGIDMFEDFEPYDFHENSGVELPKIHLTKDELAAIDPKLPVDASSLDVLRSLIRKGIIERGIDKLPNRREYYDRAKYELDIFAELGFVDYVLLNWDIIGFCHREGIITGLGRGSAPSSLILYLLKVTGIDPIEHGLFFERFVSKTRAKKVIDKNGKEFLVGSLLPDVDSDIAYDQRQKVISYIEEKHRGKTSKILTFNTFSSKLCIREAVKYFEEAKEDEAGIVSDMITKNHGIVCSLSKSVEENENFEEWSKLHEKTYKNALKVEDLYKNNGCHPSGLVICATDIQDIMPLQKTKEGDLISGYDMNDVSDLAVKFDILGLRTLTIADATCKKLGIELKDIDPNDPFIYQVMQDFRSPCGLFQVSSPTTFRACQQIKPINLDEMADVVAISRPSSLAFVDEYIQTKKNPKLLGLHEELDSILSGTKNVMLFQETLIFISNRVFGFSLEDGELLRRCCAKKKVDEIGEWKEKIYKAAEERGIETRVADYFWGVVEASASYGFNRCLQRSTIVTTEDGPKEVSRIKIGDKVLSYDTKTDTNVFVEVEDVIVSENELFEYELEDGRKITCSKKHKFLTDQGMKTINEIVENDMEIIIDEKQEYFVPVEMNDNYLVSNMGTIFSKTRGGGRDRKYGGAINKGSFDKDKYIRVLLSNGSKKQIMRAHRVVALAFLENPENHPIINHKNGIKTDNRAENLEWCSVEYNNKHAFATGLNSVKISINNLVHHKGEKHGGSKLKNEQIKEIRKRASLGETGASIARELGVSKSTVSRILRGERWNHV